MNKFEIFRIKQFIQEKYLKIRILCIYRATLRTLPVSFRPRFGLNWRAWI